MTYSVSTYAVSTYAVRSILGLTIDYGPYGWVDNFDRKWTPNTTDNRQKRYCFYNQPGIAVQPDTLDPQPLILNPQPSTLNHDPSTLNPQPWTLDPEP